MPFVDQLSRRVLLTIAGLEAVAITMRGAASARAAEPPTARKRQSPAEVSQRLRGPILSLPTPFTADFKVDHGGVSNMIRRGLEHGIPVYSMTSGNGMYASLLYDEIKDLTRTMVEAVGGRGVTIAAGGNWWTGQVVD